MTLAKYMNAKQLHFFRMGILIWLVALALYGAAHSYMPTITYWHIMGLVMTVNFGYGIYLFKED